MGNCLHQVKISTTAKDSVISTRMPNIKLTYFDLRARAEPCRLLLAYAGAKYEDERLPAPWDNMAPWAALKPNTPWGQVPLLAWDGEVIAQSMACARFLAREYNLAGRTSMEMAQVDEIIDVIQDLLNAWYSLYHAKDCRAAEVPGDQHPHWHGAAREEVGEQRWTVHGW